MPPPSDVPSPRDPSPQSPSTNGPDGSLLDELAVRSVLERYCRYIDDGRFEDAVALFAPDARIEAMGQEASGVDEIARFFGPSRPLVDRPRTQHLISACLVDVAGDEASAESDWAMLRRTPDGGTEVALAGRYRDRFRRDRGTWRFVFRRVVTLARPG